MDKAEKTKVKKAPSSSDAPAKRKKGKSLERSKAKIGWLFVAPFLIGFVLIYLPMIFESFKFAFSSMKFLGGQGGYETTFVGFENFSEALFVDPDFVKMLLTSIWGMLLNIPAVVIFALFMAIILNQKMRGRAVFRAIFFIPVIVSTGIIQMIDDKNALIEIQQQAMDAMGGAGGVAGGSASAGSSVGTQVISAMDIQRFFNNMAIGRELAVYVSDLVNSVYNIINRSGVQMLVFLARSEERRCRERV